MPAAGAPAANSESSISAPPQVSELINACTLILPFALIGAHGTRRPCPQFLLPAVAGRLKPVSARADTSLVSGIGTKVGRPFRRFAWGLYNRASSSRLAPLFELPIVARLKKRLKASLHPADVLQILDKLEAAGVHSYVAGGWGVDALLGEQTREHEDLDLLFDAGLEEQAQAALKRIGFRRAPGFDELVPHALMPNTIVMRDLRRRAVDIHWVDLRSWPASWLESGRGRSPEVVDAAAAREPFAQGSLEGCPIACISPALQVASRCVYEPSETDRKDVALLCARFGLRAPPAFKPGSRPDSGSRAD
jgi:lincosamide nucleotidyltransferase A/C/D/E